MTDPAAPTLISRSMSDEPVWAQLAADLLRSADALAGLSALDAQCIVSYARLLRCGEGQVLTREGEAAGEGFMMLVLDGEVTVETMVARREQPVVVSVAGPGHLIGETALLDGGPRTATCTATTSVIGAGLSRNALQRMMRAEPEVAAKLLAGVGQRMAQRLRDANRQQRVYHQLLGAMQAEVAELQRQLQQVMDGAARRTAQRGADAS
ncbi:cyclic nucleotide-binding domain-containing protein [Ideonella sp. 4Y16]|uniref:Crp/Fnr family transcriptional regulator n=1 Tax=Ideonella alba TaxID=2824118 RepID=UPI001B384E9C|nr:cyclic nucleotide-binding domain-containing protein [Ideonella alba]MBQ0943144.1 cyclic nucleotide-binding domain-containing protein [Ideonella alba]